MRARLYLILALAGALLVLGCGQALQQPQGLVRPGTTTGAATTGPVPLPTDYSRDRFGDGWSDPDRNGCDARNDVLARDLVEETVRADGCTVEAGLLFDPYTDREIRFVRGENSSAVQIDHVVPLSWAWQHGAWRWTQEQRVAFANDPINLRAVDGPTNSRKGDSGPAEWMPPSPKYHCAYLQSWRIVLDIYGLYDSGADQRVIAQGTARCDAELMGG